MLIMYDKHRRQNKRLLRAAKRGDEEQVLLALSHEAEIDCNRAKADTPLIRAIIAGKWSMACLLVEKGADVQGMPPEQKTPLIYAVERGDAAIVRLLLEAGAAPDALYTHITKEYYEKTDEDSGFCGFFQETSSYAISTAHHATALTLAAHEGKSEIVRILLAASAERDLRGKNDKTALECAEEKGHARVAALLRPEPEPAPVQEKEEKGAESIVFQRATGLFFLEEIYDFTARERISIIRKSKTGPIEVTTRDAFHAIVDSPFLLAAFNEHVRRGGTASEKQIFMRKLNKPQLKTPRNGGFGTGH